MVAEVFAGLGALKSAFDIARGIKDLDDAAKRNAAVIGLQQTILTAQQAQAALLEEMDRLKKENAVKEWEVGKDDYQLIKLGNETFVYTMKLSNSGDPAHHLCPNCFTDRKKSILQKSVTHVGRWTVYACNRCGVGNLPGWWRRSPNASKR